MFSNLLSAICQPLSRLSYSKFRWIETIIIFSQHILELFITDTWVSWLQFGFSRPWYPPQNVLCCMLCHPFMISLVSGRDISLNSRKNMESCWFFDILYERSKKYVQLMFELCTYRLEFCQILVSFWRGQFPWVNDVSILIRPNKWKEQAKRIQKYKDNALWEFRRGNTTKLLNLFSKRG